MKRNDSVYINSPNPLKCVSKLEPCHLGSVFLIFLHAWKGLTRAIVFSFIHFKLNRVMVRNSTTFKLAESCVDLSFFILNAKKSIKVKTQKLIFNRSNCDRKS